MQFRDASNIPVSMTTKKIRERILGRKFLAFLRRNSGKSLSLVRFQDRPDLLLQETSTRKFIGVEITELLHTQDGKERSHAQVSADMVEKELIKHASGGIVSVGFGTAFPENKQKRNDLVAALESAIKTCGSLERFAEEIKKRAWTHLGFVISEIHIDPNMEDWELFTDAPLSYQLSLSDEDMLMNCVSKKAAQARDYLLTDELHLLVRNPYEKLTITESGKRKLFGLKGRLITAVWVVNWKMNAFPVHPTFSRIDWQQK